MIRIRRLDDWTTTFVFPSCVLGLGRTVRLEAFGRRQSRLPSDLDDLSALFEVGAREVFALQIGRNEDVTLVQRLDRSPDVLFRQQIHHLRHDAHYVRELVPPRKRRSHVHGDDDVGSHFPSQPDGQIVDEPPVDEECSFVFERRECSRHRHRGTHRFTERAVLLHDDASPVYEVRRRRRKRNGKTCEIVHHVDPTRPGRQKERKLLRRNDGFGELQFASGIDLNGARREPLIIVFFFAPGEICAVRAGSKHLVPVDTHDDPLDFLRRITRRVGAPDHGAHARTRHDVDLDPQLLEYFQHAHMSKPSGAAPRKHEPHARTPFGAAFRTDFVGSGRRGIRNTGKHLKCRRDRNGSNSPCVRPGKHRRSTVCEKQSEKHGDPRWRDWWPRPIGEKR